MEKKGAEVRLEWKKMEEGSDKNEKKGGGVRLEWKKKEQRSDWNGKKWRRGQTGMEKKMEEGLDWNGKIIGGGVRLD